MLADPAATLRQLAAFVGVELSTHLEDDTHALIITNPHLTLPGVELSTHLEDDTHALIITNPNPNLTSP